jgi:hypothetical protein
VDWRLDAGGLQRVDGSGDPDLVVVYNTAVNTPLQVDITNLEGWGSGWSWNSGMAGASIADGEQLAPGDLAIDIARVKDKKYIWHAMAVGFISDRPAKTLKILNTALDKMFQKFPPAYKK